MTGSIIALLIAILGVVGTLVSALLTQRAADRAKLRDLEAAERRRIDDREFDIRRSRVAERRSCYIALNTAARQHHSVLRNCFHALKEGPIPESLLDRLEQARLEHRSRHSEAQMVVPDEVLLAVGRANEKLNASYGMVQRLASGRATDGDHPEALLVELDELWNRLYAMRTLMRDDLGVSSPSAISEGPESAGAPFANWSEGADEIDRPESPADRAGPAIGG